MSSVLGPGCARVRARLEERLDGALPALEEARDRGHVEACAACARAEARVLRVLADLRVLVPSEPEELALVAQRLRATLPRRARARPRERWWLAAAAAALLLALGAFYGPPRTPRAADLAPEDVLSTLPDWASVLRGLGDLTRPFS